LATFNHISDLKIDWDHLHQLSDDDPQFELELLNLFLQDALTHVSRIQEAIAHLNYAQIRASAHHLKGASSNVGLYQLADLADQMELQAERQVAGQQIRETNQSLQKRLEQLRHLVSTH
jgi:HPt (histidine-containing phosphotransfer) domain-containing protein